MAHISRPARIRATVRVPGDKSISHRALLFNAIADGEASVEDILDSADVRSTAACLRQLGVEIDWPEGGKTAQVHGRGLHGLQESSDILDCGNSGTTMRLISGLLAGQPALSVLTGDASLRTRPMGRIIEPLQRMGGHLHGRDHDRLAPIVIQGGGLHGMQFDSPVASAQVKSAVLLAALFAEGSTTVVEPAASRDHTERMLANMGADIGLLERGARLTPVERLNPLSMRVPGDISSAAPWLVLAACHPDAEIVLEHVNTNPTRTGILDILKAMGADFELEEARTSGGEPVADIRICSSRLRPTHVSGAVIPRAIDELPLVALLGCFADGETAVADAGELAVKESDRIAALVRVLGAMGANITPRTDGFVVHGPCALHGASVDAEGDHRVGMLAAVAGALAEGETEVGNDAVEVSYPTFWGELRDTVEGSKTSRMTKKPLVLVLHGPAGVGKDTVIGKLRERIQIRRATSSTTRAPREGEVDDVDYHFLSWAEFQAGIAEGDFVEWAKVYGDLKGVETSEVTGPISRGEDLIIRTDVQGARMWRSRLEGAISIILIADRETLRKRLIERASETVDSLELRLAEIDEELADVPNNDYVIHNRDGALDEAVEEVIRIIERERENAERPTPRLLAIAE